MQNIEFEFDVALSFAGENREYVDRVAECLRNNSVNVFYDKYEDLWGKDLYQHLDDVFQNKAKYAVVFASKYYAQKLWPSHELKSAQARVIKEKGDYLLPVRFDDTDIPGIRSTLGYIDARKTTPEELCDKILEKLNRKVSQILHIDEEIELPIIKRKINDFEKDKFVQESFMILKEYFAKALYKLESAEENVNAKLDEISKSKFVAKIYIDGELKTMCKIWIGSGMSFGGSISYLEGRGNLDIDGDSSLNDYATVEDNGKDIFFKISAMGFGMVDESIEREKASAKDLAVYFWKRFIKNLN